MKKAVLALTKSGAELAFRIGAELQAEIYMKEEFAGEQSPPVHLLGEDFGELVQKIFPEYDALVMIMACGIAVRTIAPCLTDKYHDPAVVVLDEKGRYVISLLSGHHGGANRLATEVAAVTGGAPVITTATDLNGVPAFDVFALENDCRLENPAVLKKISAELANAGQVGLYTDYPLENLPTCLVPCSFGAPNPVRYGVVFSNRIHLEVAGEKILTVRPRNLILGVGCRRGIAPNRLRQAVRDFFRRQKRSLLSLKIVATVDLKNKEPGILELVNNYGVSFRNITRQAIKNLGVGYTRSEFVERQIGVGGVAEPCALLAAEQTKLICGKTIYPGITLALAEEVKTYRL